MPASTRITSRQHPLVRHCRAVARTPSDGDVLLDGEHLVAEALDAGIHVRTLLSLEGRSGELAARARRQGARTYDVSRAVLDAASPVRQPSGVLAIAAWAAVPVEAVLGAPDGPVLALVDVQDPGNVGSAIRTADALGATGVLALDATADPAGWKALRGAMGSTFRIPVARGRSAGALAAARARGWQVAATLPRGGTPPAALATRAKLIVLVGNEGAGLPDPLVDAADLHLSVPMRAGVDSLNVAVCSALVLDGLRQERPADADPDPAARGRSS